MKTSHDMVEKMLKAEKARKENLKQQKANVKEQLGEVEKVIAKQKLADKRFEINQRDLHKKLQQEDQEYRQQKQEHEQTRFQEQHKADLEHFHKIYRKRNNNNQSEENFFKNMEASFEELVENMQLHDRNREHQIQDRVERVRKHIGLLDNKIRLVKEERTTGSHLVGQIELVEKLASKQKAVDENRKAYLKNLSTPSDKTLELAE